MGSDEWLLIGVNAMAASLLLNSGIAKAVAPDALRRALAELVSVFRTENSLSLLRGLAIVEIVAGAGLLIAPVRMPAVALTSLLGVGFAVLGLLGRLRGGSAPCGCFGASSRQPLGWTNVALGAMLAAVYPVNTASGVALGSPADYTAGAVLLASMGSLALCMYMHRRLIDRHFVTRYRGPKPTR